MSESESETEKSGWTKENLQQLFASLKHNIPKRYMMCVYTKGLKTVDWKKVAFPPFSPEACQEKWKEIFQKMRKLRSLTELITEAEDVLSNPVRNRKIHPDFPKRPTPPNAMYFEENWAKFQEQHPEMSHKKVVEVLFKKYKVLPDEEKAQYVEKHQLAMKKYKARVLKFRKQNHKSPDRTHRTSQKRKKVSADTPDGEQCTEGLPPKPPFNGYNLFCKEQVASMAGVSRKEYVSVWAQRWRNLTERQRNEYSVRCRELKSQYAIKLSQHLNTSDEDEQQWIRDESGIKQPKEHKGITREVKKLLGEPKMPSRSGNVFFCKSQMEILKEEFPDAKERFIKVNERWQNLSTKEKECYKGKVQESFRKYSMELQKWFKTLSAEEQENYRKKNPSKCQYLDPKQVKVHKREELCLNRTSDSEDEDIDSSSDEEERNLDSYEEEEEEEEGDITFDMY
ncbi:nucleolar transcription factor 1-like isoform X2 [Toxotes jaculatrix]|uniref:nucleolar transcription factor 1-like isoform X2 n=1 Tax=Toxotes jaculatrix TaxID=941984 RepID=UPI001B3ACEC9|nr:nucleolar transcription factor 1-like isoform X2 [Toxotes jaculatrix]